jgi:hypothetical protein
MSDNRIQKSVGESARRLAESIRQESSRGADCDRKQVSVDPRSARAEAQQRLESWIENQSVAPRQGPLPKMLTEAPASVGERVEQLILKHGDGVAGAALWHGVGVGAFALNPGLGIGVLGAYYATHVPNHEGEGAKQIVEGSTMLIHPPH